MSSSPEPNPPPEPPQAPKIRVISGTEHSWCRAVPGGTGTTILSFLTKIKPNLSLLTTSLHSLQTTYPILRSLLHHSAATSTFSLLIPPLPASLTVHSHDAVSTANIIQHSDPSISPFQNILEHEMNLNPWDRGDNGGGDDDDDVSVMHASVYEVKEGRKWTVVIKLHTAACDRTAAVWILKELLRLMSCGGGGGGAVEEVREGEVLAAIEEYVASEKRNKPLWSRGINMIGYSLNSFRLCNLEFVEPGEKRCSKVVRLVLDSSHTSKLLQGCKTRGIKLCGALSAAGLMAARLSKGLSDGEWEKYAVVTLIDCRKHLEPPLSNRHVGFYHSAILNTHDMQGGEELWQLAGRTYNSFKDAKDKNKHFSDMADLNFLMCRAIENPGLTPSSSMRTSFISVFEDLVIDEASKNYTDLGVEDYMGCASAHGVGPSIAIFDTIRDGKLDCACIYPFPLHSREQMQELIDSMTKILIDCCESS